MLRRTRRVALLALLLPLAACALRNEPIASDPTYPVPLEVRIWPDGSHYGVYVNRPAYVAIFEIVSGTGMGLVHPSHPSHVRRLEAGYSPVWRGLGLHRWAYMTDPPGSFRSIRGRHLMVVASERPLEIERYIGATALRRAMPLHQFAALNSYRAMDQLIEMVLPEQPWYDTAVDVYYLWGTARDRSVMAGVTVTCPDGQSYWVRIDVHSTLNPCRLPRLVLLGDVVKPPDDGDDEREIDDRRRTIEYPPAIQPVESPRPVVAARQAVGNDDGREIVIAGPSIREPGWIEGRRTARFHSPEAEAEDPFTRLGRHWSNRDPFARGPRDATIRGGREQTGRAAAGGRAGGHGEATRRAQDRSAEPATRSAGTGRSGREVQPSRPPGNDDRRPQDP